ncbi:MAG: beta-ketoacyl synthase chain length factor [Thermomonas sp.]
MLSVDIAGIGFWTRGLPSWAAACDYLRNGATDEAAPDKPASRLLAANERRRAPETVAVALEVALAACEAAGVDPATLPSVFVSMHGDLAITDYMCATLTEDPRAISPTKFHNSVHNAAAGYWTIGTGCNQPATALSSGDGTFALGLLEALSQLQSGEPTVLLAAYDGTSTGPLASISSSENLLGGALVLASHAANPVARVQVEFLNTPAPVALGKLAGYVGTNAMAPMLPLFEALASGADEVWLHAGPLQAVHITITRGPLS